MFWRLYEEVVRAFNFESFGSKDCKLLHRPFLSHTFVIIHLLGFVFKWMLCHMHFKNIQIEGTHLLNIGMSKSVNIVVLCYNFGIDWIIFNFVYFQKKASYVKKSKIYGQIWTLTFSSVVQVCEDNPTRKIIENIWWWKLFSYI